VRHDEGCLVQQKHVAVSITTVQCCA